MTTVDRTTTALRRRTVLGAVLRTALMMTVSASGLAGATRAEAGVDPVELAVVDRETGQPLQVWRRDGRLFVAGQPGVRYGLRVTNHTDGRVLVVMSVDGVNIISGQTAGYGQRGYVFGPYELYVLNGWRKSESEVAAFTFAPLPQSYAARTGRPGDVGVIGIAAFKERVVVPEPVTPVIELRAEPRDPEQRAANDRRAAGKAASDSGVSELVVTAQRRQPAAPAEAPRALERPTEKLGTAHGAREWSVSTTVAFERATSTPQFVRQLEYDTFENLVARGVIRPSRDLGNRPRPFPATGGGYVPDPPGWR